MRATVQDCQLAAPPLSQENTKWFDVRMWEQKPELPYRHAQYRAKVQQLLNVQTGAWVVRLPR